MSVWSDDSGDDIFDPSAPFQSAPAPSTDGVEPAPEVADIDPNVPWSPAQGYPDSTGSVRVWLDENRRLTQVRVSNAWRDRARGTTLSSMFDEAFLLAQAQAGQAVDPPKDPMADLPATKTTLSWDSLEALNERAERLDEEYERIDRLPEDQIKQSAWVGTPVEGSSENRMVTVRLNLYGLTEQVVFEETWLKGSRVSQVIDGVMEAHQAAYAAFVPPQFELGDRERLAVQAANVRDEAMAVIRRGW